MEEEEWAGLLLLSGVPSERLDWGGRRSGLLLLLLLLLVLLPSRATELERGGGGVGFLSGSELRLSLGLLPIS